PEWPKVAAKAVLEMAETGPPGTRDPLHGVEVAEELCQATGFADPQWLDTLALAYAAAGRITDAAATAQKALTLATDTALARRIEQRLRTLQNAGPRE